ncbi:mitochondrial inner membrane protease subunit 1 [Nilaparvata lugens]|uniref:mitochondrial inner membrane protease subunit 1 n=1 Tax=Nilaparvata lugens TaxID=108931 RepID=UPI00193EBB78|nr:mitochondrial inner membrane protease subunit 1 [Nilaparvata lugens]
MNQFKSSFIKITGFVSCLVQASCLAHCALEYGADFVVCSGPSMEPTILTDNVILSEHVSPRLRTIKQGDIVIAKSPVNPTQFICKRVTGLPGDKVRSTFNYNVVPVGHVWLEGDNRDNSSDSRTFGPVPAALIRGRVLCRVWPISDIQMMTSGQIEKVK